MSSRVWTAWILAAGCVACGGSPSAPAAPVPTVALTAVSEFGALAIRGVSVVTFSTPLAVLDATYAIDFGDGESGRMSPPIRPSPTTTVAFHKYLKSGTFTAQLTVIDAAGSNRLATGLAAAVTVREMDGRWSNTTFSNATSRLETRRFDWIQSGSLLSGSYVDQDGLSHAIAGSMSDPRSIAIALDGQPLCQGTDLDRTGIANDLNAFTVIFQSAPGRVPMTFVRQ